MDKIAQKVANRYQARSKKAAAKVSVRDKVVVSPGTTVAIQASRGIDDLAWKVKIVVDAEIGKATINDIGYIPSRIQPAITKFIPKANKAASRENLLDLWRDMAQALR